MALNPEFRRNIWLEINTHRLIATPIIIGALLYLVYILGHDDAGLLNGAALWIFGLLTFVWGSRASAVSIASEARGLTWDSQRMSALGPWSLTWGKIFGANSYTWYAAAFPLVAYVATMNTSRFESASISALLLVFFCALWAQALGLLFGLAAVVRREVGIRADYGAVGGVLVGIFALSALASFGKSNALRTVNWYFMTVYVSEFSVFTAIVFFLWTVFGAYWLMRMELRFRTAFLPWLAFMVFMMAYFSGFASAFAGNDVSEYAAGVTISFSVAALLTYVSLLAQRKDPVAFRTLLRAVSAGNWNPVVELVPNWAATLPIVGAAAVWAEFASGRGFHYAYVTMFFFLVRDAALVLFFNLGKNAARADLAALIYLCVLYGLVPGILAALGANDWIFVAYPGISDFGLPAAVIEAAAAAVLLALRWRKNFSMVSGPIQQEF